VYIPSTEIDLRTATVGAPNHFTHSPVVIPGRGKFVLRRYQAQQGFWINARAHRQ